MKEKIFNILTILIITVNGLFAQETINVMFYNLLNFPLQTTPANRIDHLEAILSDYQPDLFMVCELNNETGADEILTMMQQSINSNYNRAAFVLNTSDDAFGDQNDLQNLIYYDSTKFILESQTEVTTIYRDFNHYKLKLNTVNQASDPIYLDVIVGHLKAASGSDNAALRFQMVQDLVAYLETLPTDSNIILGGDLNLYSASENAFIELLDDTNAITFVDPANKIGSWHNNTNFIDVFTQSTRTSSGLGGATGGFDDRFDFILASESLVSNTEIELVNDSYQVYGNNGNVDCYNQAINSSDCSGTDFSSAIRNSLYNFSDHLPVTVQLESSQSLSIAELVAQKAIEIIGYNIIDKTLKLKLDISRINGQSLAFYNSIGQLIKTVETSHSEIIDIDTSMLSGGIYYITLPQLNINPLKFVIAH